MRLRQKKSLLDQAGEYVEAVRPQLESAVDRAMDYVENTALPLLHEARDKAAPVIADARDKAGPALADARAKAGPALADARAKAAPIIASGAAYAAEKATVGATLAAEKAAVGRELAAEKAAVGRDLAAAKVAELQGKPVKKKGGKLKKIVLIGGLAAIAGAIAKKLQGKPAADNWQSSYVPTPAPRPSTPSGTTTGATSTDTTSTGAEDTAGSSPDEALADQAEGAHPVTTPDDPAEVVDIDDAPSANGGNHKA